MRGQFLMSSRAKQQPIWIPGVNFPDDPFDIYEQMKIRSASTAAREGKRLAGDREPGYRRRDAVARDLPAKTKLTGSTED
jgi:hypothetical protein